MGRKPTEPIDPDHREEEEKAQPLRHPGFSGPCRPLKGRITRRLLDSNDAIIEEEPEAPLFHHTVLCQTSLPYRDPGAETRVWERRNGAAHLKVYAGEAMHPGKQRLVPLGLPFGPKPRMILAYLNATALRTSSPTIDVEPSLTAFTKRLRLAPKGRNIRIIKDQLARLSAATIRVGMVHNGRATTINTQIVTEFEIWFPKDDRQRVLWPTTVRLSSEYFESLQAHAVPLDERAVAALAHSAMALDIYAWLAERLHRVKVGKPKLVRWPALQEQFGWNYDRPRKFREAFRETLALVHTQYPRAQFDVEPEGMVLWHSVPPVSPRDKT